MVLFGVAVFFLVFLNFAFKKARTVREGGYSSAAALVTVGSIALAVSLFVALYPLLAWVSKS